MLYGPLKPITIVYLARKEPAPLPNAAVVLSCNVHNNDIQPLLGLREPRHRSKAKIGNLIYTCRVHLNIIIDAKCTVFSLMFGRLYPSAHGEDVTGAKARPHLPTVAHLLWCNINALKVYNYSL